MHATVTAIMKDEVRVKGTAKIMAEYKAVMTRQSKGLINQMEKLLAIWL